MSARLGKPGPPRPPARRHQHTYEQPRLRVIDHGPNAMSGAIASRSAGAIKRFAKTSPMKVLGPPRESPRGIPQLPAAAHGGEPAGAAGSRRFPARWRTPD